MILFGMKIFAGNPVEVTMLVPVKYNWCSNKKRKFGQRQGHEEL